MKYRLLVGLTIIFLFSSIAVAHAQVDDDTRVWTGFTAKFELLEPLRFDVTQELRIDDNFSGFEKTLTDLALRFRVLEYLRISGRYRFIVADTVAGTDLQHRLTAEADARYELDRLRFGYRLRLQTTSTDQGQRSFVRNKLATSYKVTKDLEPFLAFEVHYSTTASEFRQLRFYAGMEYELSKRLAIEGYYLYRYEFNVAVPERNHIIGLDLSYTFRKVGKKKKKKKD